jgi:hypothetical protein
MGKRHPNKKKKRWIPTETPPMATLPPLTQDEIEKRMEEYERKAQAMFAEFRTPEWQKENDEINRRIMREHRKHEAELTRWTNIVAIKRAADL